MNALACRPDSRVVHQECQDCDRARPGPVTARAGSDSGSRPADASHPSGMGDGGRGDARIDRPAEGEDPTARIRRRGSDRASLPSQLGQHWVSFDSRKRPINPPQGVGNRAPESARGCLRPRTSSSSSRRASGTPVTPGSWPPPRSPGVGRGGVLPAGAGGRDHARGPARQPATPRRAIPCVATVRRSLTIIYKLYC